VGEAEGDPAVAAARKAMYSGEFFTSAIMPSRFAVRCCQVSSDACGGGRPTRLAEGVVGNIGGTPAAAAACGGGRPTRLTEGVVGSIGGTPAAAAASVTSFLERLRKGKNSDDELCFLSKCRRFVDDGAVASSGLFDDPHKSRRAPEVNCSLNVPTAVAAEAIAKPSEALPPGAAELVLLLLLPGTNTGAWAFGVHAAGEGREVAEEPDAAAAARGAAPAATASDAAPLTSDRSWPARPVLSGLLACGGCVSPPPMETSEAERPRAATLRLKALCESSNNSLSGCVSQ